MGNPGYWKLLKERPIGDIKKQEQSNFEFCSSHAEKNIGIDFSVVLITSKTSRPEIFLPIFMETDNTTAVALAVERAASYIAELCHPIIGQCQQFVSIFIDGIPLEGSKHASAKRSRYNLKQLNKSILQLINGIFF